MKYKIDDTIFTDPTITLYSYKRDFESNISVIDFLIEDSKDSVSITEQDISMPNEWTEDSIKQWVFDVILKKYEI